MPMSNAGSEPQGPRPPHTPAEVARTARQEARFGAAFFRVYGPRLLLAFLGVLLPLWGFGALVAELREGEPFAFDQPVLELLHGQASPALDRFALAASAVGYAWGVMPFDVLFVLALAWRRHFREGLFAGLALLGSALLNLGAKHSFRRVRPALWTSIAPEHSYSFPSGHAMGSMTLALTLLLLCWSARTPWGTPWRWWATVLGGLFVLSVGWARIYLGVHYPSDILAGWCAAAVWTAGAYGLVFRGTLKPWTKSPPRPVPEPSA
ncbi:MAG TPA: phosphatase PAP2 family protein [Xanthomonadaceae bacterium]|nr:phosphatase PAP2 family protein [Xanthomonadaceae bacterium]